MLLRLLQATVVIGGAGLAAGDRGALGAALALALLLVCRLVQGVPAGRLGPLVAVGESDRQPRFPGYDRLYGVLLLSGSSGRHVDLALRPVVQRILAGELEDRGAQALRTRLGARWWALVDPARPGTSDSSQGGLTRPDLRDLLDELEAG